MSFSRENLKRKCIDDSEEEFKIVTVTLNETVVKNIQERAFGYAPLVLEGLQSLLQWNMPLTPELIDYAILARSEALAFCTNMKALYGQGMTVTETMMMALSQTSFKIKLTQLLLEISFLNIPPTDQIVRTSLLFDRDKLDDYGLALLMLHYHGYLYEHFIDTLSQFRDDPVKVADQLVADYQAQSCIIDAFLNNPEQSENLPMEKRALPLPKVITNLVRTFFSHPGIMTEPQRAHLESYKERTKHSKKENFCLFRLV